MTRCDHTTSPSGEKLIANRPNISGQAFNASKFHRISETTALVRLLLELLEEARSAMKCASRGRPDMTKRVRIVAGLAVSLLVLPSASTAGDRDDQADSLGGVTL
jgi:hypothetical protein